MRKFGLFARKPIGRISSETEQERSGGLKRHFNAFHLTSIGVGAIIGAGIFVITGQAAANYAGPAILLSFIIAAVICVFAGLCYAELSSMIPVSGGAYSYSYAAMGEFAAWIVGWSVVLQYLVSGCTVAVGWSGYFVSFLKDFGLALPPEWTSAPIEYGATGWHLSGAILNLPAVFLVLLLGLLLSVGVSAVSKLNNIMVFIKLSAIVLFVVLGISFVQSSNWTPFIPENTGIFGEFGWSGVFRAAGFVFFAYNGFDTVATLAQETIHPQKNVPRGILGSLTVSTLAYIATVLVLTGVVSYTALNVPDPMAVALNAMGSGFIWLTFVVKVAILAGLASVVLAQLLGQTRIFFAMSEDGLLPRRFSQVNPVSRTPLFSSLLTAGAAILISGLFPVTLLGQLVSLAVIFIYAIVCCGVLILRYTHPEIPRAFKVPFVPYVPLLGMFACIGQMFFLPLAIWAQLIVWMLIGFLVYFSYGMKHSHIRKKR